MLDPTENQGDHLPTNADMCGCCRPCTSSPVWYAQLRRNNCIGMASLSGGTYGFGHHHMRNQLSFAHLHHNNYIVP